VPVAGVMTIGKPVQECRDVGELGVVEARRLAGTAVVWRLHFRRVCLSSAHAAGDQSRQIRRTRSLGALRMKAGRERPEHVVAPRIGCE
jgi:hypothetical protein